MASPRLDIRADQETLDRIDRLAARLSRPGAELTRSDATRAAVLRGLDAMEAELGPAPKPAAKKGKTPGKA